MKVLVIGDMTEGRNARSVAEGYRAVGHDVRFVDTSASLRGRRGGSLWRSVRATRTVDAHEQLRFSSDLREATDAFRPQLLLAVKTVLYDQAEILAIPADIHVHLSFDDVSNPENTSPAYLAHESSWDLIVTTKRHNIDELYARGAKRVEYVWGAFDPLYRRRLTPFDNREFEIGFIGASRPDRSRLPSEFSANAHDVGLIVGPRWRRDYPVGKRGVQMEGLSIGDQYTRQANRLKIGLVLLNSDNRDQHTNRSIETPATGQLILAERTAEHLELFDEGREAVFFSDREELWSAFRRLRSSPNEARAIAGNGYQRVTTGRFTYRDRAEDLARLVSEM